MPPLLFAEGQLAWLRPIWQDGSIVPLVSKATTAVLLRVLACPKFQLTPEEREELLGEFLPFADIVPDSLTKCDVPRVAATQTIMFFFKSRQPARQMR